MIRAFAGSPVTKVRLDRNAWYGRIDRGLRNLKVSHSQVRIQIGMLRESNNDTRKQLVQLRADVHDLESTVKGKSPRTQEKKNT